MIDWFEDKFFTLLAIVCYPLVFTYWLLIVVVAVFKRKVPVFPLNWFTRPLATLCVKVAVKDSNDECKD